MDESDEFLDMSCFSRKAVGQVEIEQVCDDTAYLKAHSTHCCTKEQMERLIILVIENKHRRVNFILENWKLFMEYESLDLDESSVLNTKKLSLSFLQNKAVKIPTADIYMYDFAEATYRNPYPVRGPQTFSGLRNDDNKSFWISLHHSLNKCPWKYSIKQESSSAAEIITKGPWYTAPHADFSHIGGYSILPHFLDGVCKIWFVSTKIGRDWDQFFIDHKNEVPLKHEIDRILDFVDKGYMEVILHRPGEVMRVPSSTVHAVLTIFNPDKNLVCISIMFTYFAKTKSGEIPNIRVMQKEIKGKTTKESNRLRNFVNDIYGKNEVAKAVKVSKEHGQKITRAKSSKKNKLFDKLRIAREKKSEKNGLIKN